MTQPDRQQESNGWLDRPENVRRLWQALIGVCIALALAGLFVDLHPHFEFEGWPVFYGVFGFVAYVSIVFMAKMLRRLLRRDENYYDV